MRNKEERHAGHGRKENIVLAAVMSAVSCLVLITASIAWFSSNLGVASVELGDIHVEEQKDIKVAITSGGKDIASSTGEAAKIKIGLEELTNIKEGEIAPGAFGKVQFYITPLSQGVTGYEIVPTLFTVMGEGLDDSKLAAFLEMFGRHIVMFADEQCTQPITEDKPAAGALSWDEATNEGIEKEVTLYWKWHYEYPFSVQEEASLSELQKQEKIDGYDTEDTEIGNHIDTIQFRFTFLATS